MVHEKLKEDVKKLIAEAQNSAQKLEKGPAPIENCDVFQLSYLIGDTDEARVATMILSKILPDDPEVKKMWSDASYANRTAYKGRDRFTEKCECKKK